MPYFVLTQNIFSRDLDDTVPLYSIDEEDITTESSCDYEIVFTTEHNDMIDECVTLDELVIKETFCDRDSKEEKQATIEECIKEINDQVEKFSYTSVKRDLKSVSSSLVCETTQSSKECSLSSHDSSNFSPKSISKEVNSSNDATNLQADDNIECFDDEKLNNVGKTSINDASHSKIYEINDCRASEDFYENVAAEKNEMPLRTTSTYDEHYPCQSAINLPATSLIKERVSQRLSYFSSLKTINVDSAKIYGSFIAEEDECDEIEDRGDLPNGDGINKIEKEVDIKVANTLENCDASNNNAAFQEKSYLLLTDEEGLNASDVSSASEIQTTKSSSYNFVEPQNIGMIMSEGSTSSGYCDQTNYSKQELSIVSDYACLLNESTTSPLAAAIPKRIFNDTVEEMEFILNYGDKYFQEKAASSELPELPCPSPEEEAILSSPHKKSSVSSTITHFDSTRKSSDLGEKVCPVQDTEILKTPKKSTSPPKPPRNSYSANEKKNERVSPLCDNSARRTKPVFSKIPKPNVNLPKQRLSFEGKSVMKTPNSRLNTTPTKDSRIISASKLFLSLKPQQKVFSRIEKPFLTPQSGRTCNKFKTPQGLTGKLQQSNSDSDRKKMRRLERPSPVAKYLQNNPPPPLITNVKPRFKISPLRLQSNLLESNKKVDSIKPLSSNMLSKFKNHQNSYDRLDAAMEELTNKLHNLQNPIQVRQLFTYSYVFSVVLLLY